MITRQSVITYAPKKLQSSTVTSSSNNNNGSSSRKKKLSKMSSSEANDVITKSLGVKLTPTISGDSGAVIVTPSITTITTATSSARNNNTIVSSSSSSATSLSSSVEKQRDNARLALLARRSQANASKQSTSSTSTSSVSTTASLLNNLRSSVPSSKPSVPSSTPTAATEKATVTDASNGRVYEVKASLLQTIQMRDKENEYKNSEHYQLYQQHQRQLADLPRLLRVIQSIMQSSLAAATKGADPATARAIMTRARTMPWSKAIPSLVPTLVANNKTTGHHTMTSTDIHQCLQLAATLFPEHFAIIKPAAHVHDCFKILQQQEINNTIKAITNMAAAPYVPPSTTAATVATSC
jgi:hypothetical protein